MPNFDQGDQRRQGPLWGRVGRWFTIARHGIREQWNNRVLRIFLLLAWLPALGLVGAVVLWGLVEHKCEGASALLSGLPTDVLQDPHLYRTAAWTLAYSYFFKVELFFIMLLVAIAIPGLISQDLRSNASPLYSDRPLTRLDCFLGKLGVIGALVASVAVGPALFTYVVGLGFYLDRSVIKETYPILLGSVAYGLVITLSVGTLILAISSLMRRSLYAGIIWAGLWIISFVVGGKWTEMHDNSVRREIQVTEMNRWLDEHPPPRGAQLLDTPNGRRPQLQVKPETGKRQLAGLGPEQEREGDRWYRAWVRAEGQVGTKAQAALVMATREDWRPLCSYVSNLDRMADVLLDTDAAWISIGRAIERSRRTTFERGLGAVPMRRGSSRGFQAGNERQLADQMVPQYPWWWSACVLASLLGLSILTLARRIKAP